MHRQDAGKGGIIFIMGRDDDIDKYSNKRSCSLWNTNFLFDKLSDIRYNRN